MINTQGVYGLYKKARNASWQALVDNRINALPVDIVKVANNNGIKLLKNSEIKELKSGELGISIYDNNEWFIVYDDTLLLGRKRFTVAHELGHIFLGHPFSMGFHARTVFVNTSLTETEANIFASRFLSPACVLWGLDIHSASDISKICQISMESARIRAKRMEELYRRNRFLEKPLERKVFKQFETFINQNKKFIQN